MKATNSICVWTFYFGGGELVEKKDIMYENLVVRFQQKNGFVKVGHKGYAVLTALWENAARDGWAEKIECYNRDLVAMAGLRDTADLYFIRQKLIKHGFMQNYVGPGQGSRDSSIYFLDFNF